MKRIFLLYLVLLMVLQGSSVKAQEAAELDKFFEKANNIKFTNPDSAAVYFKQSVAYQLNQKDTIKAIYSLRQLSFLYAHNVNYSEAYDNYWDALILADSSKDSISMASVYEDIGWLYSFYDRDQAAVKYFNLALDLNKNQIEKIDPQNVVSNYYALAVFNRKLNNFDMVRKYLDSCAITVKEHSIPETDYYAAVEYGYLEGQTGDFETGLKVLNESRSYFLDFDPSYLIVIDYLIGETYRKNGDFQNSERYFLSALEYGDSFHTHSNYFAKLYQSLADLYAVNGKFSEAYKSLKKAKTLDEKIYGAKSKNNAQLLQIKDDFRLEKEEQLFKQKEQRLQQLEQEDRIWFLKTLLLVGGLLFVILIGWLINRNLRIKHKSEKELIDRERKLELEKHKELLEFKNKELATSALQLIEKEEFLNNLKSKIKSHGNPMVEVKAINRMINIAQGSTANNWQEFEARFVDVNQSFYENLRKQFPKLSKSDQKICALIKLNFSSKEMASLLAISVESIHTSRYRLRKKLQLKREESLSEFIDNI